MLRLRQFSTSDLGKIMKITHATLGESYSSNLYINIYNSWREGFMVAEYMGELVGFAAGTISEQHSARILMLAVVDEFRCRGIGTMLLNAFMNECALKGIRTISLEVRKSNSIAVKFYTRFGFQIIKILPRYYSDGEDGYQMWKNL